VAFGQAFGLWGILEGLDMLLLPMVFGRTVIGTSVMLESLRTKVQPTASAFCQECASQHALAMGKTTRHLGYLDQRPKLMLSRRVLGILAQEPGML
jgi:hypothetical protein